MSALVSVIHSPLTLFTGWEVGHYRDIPRVTMTMRELVFNSTALPPSPVLELEPELPSNSTRSCGGRGESSGPLLLVLYAVIPLIR